MVATDFELCFFMAFLVELKQILIFLVFGRFRKMTFRNVEFGSAVVYFLSELDFTFVLLPIKILFRSLLFERLTSSLGLDCNFRIA